MTPNQTVSHRPLCAISTMAIVLCVLISTAAAAEVPVGCETKIDPPLRDFSQPPNLNLFKRELLYYRCTRYDTDIGLVLREAQDWVKRRAPQVNNPAIVLDIDETSLSNWKRIYVDDYRSALAILRRGVKHAAISIGSGVSKPRRSSLRWISICLRSALTSARRALRSTYSS